MGCQGDSKYYSKILVQKYSFIHTCIYKTHKELAIGTFLCNIFNNLSSSSSLSSTPLSYCFSRFSYNEKLWNFNFYFNLILIVLFMRLNLLFNNFLTTKMPCNYSLFWHMICLNDLPKWTLFVIDILDSYKPRLLFPL